MKRRQRLAQRLHRQYAARPLHLPAHYDHTPLPPVENLPLVTFVTPSLNQADFIERTIISVLDQNYPNLEYIVQDGRSTDGTLEILEQYRQALKVIDTQPDEGQSQALNRGFAHSCGEIMAWLNADDLLLPGSVAYIVNYFLNHPDVDVVYGHRILINETDGEIGRWFMPPHSDDVLRWADYVPQETLFWRRRIWEKAGGRLDETYQFALDWELLLRFQAAGARFARLPRFLGAFRVHPGQKNITLYETGQREMARLRQQLHGRSVNWLEIKWHTVWFLVQSGWLYLLFRLGLLRT